MLNKSCSHLVRILFLLALLVAAAALAVTTSTVAQQDLPLDTQAVFRTHVPHANVNGNGKAGKPGRGGGGTPPPTVVFNASMYGPLTPVVVAPTTTAPEAEEHIAVDPGNSTNLVAMISDFTLRGGFNTSKYAFSIGGNGAGGTWTESFVPTNAGNSAPITQDNLTGWDANSDPVVAIDNARRVYLANLYFNCAGCPNNNSANGLYVSVGSLDSANLGITAAGTVPVASHLDANTTIDEDKEWIAVDNSASSCGGNVYVSWTRFNGNSDAIMFSQSNNHGASWSTPIQISPTGQNGAVQGSQVAAGPNGEVYIAYEVFFVGGNRAHFLSKGTCTAGVAGSFSAAAQITPLFKELSFNSSYRKNSVPALAVSGSNVYDVFAAQSSVGAQVQFVGSSNGGATFSSPLALNDSSTGQHFMPAVTTDPAGNIHASWFDTRLTGTSSSYDIFATFSTDGGATFAHNKRVTSSSINAGNASFIGDYAGIAASSGSSHPVWTNGGFNGGQLQTATLSY